MQNQISGLQKTVQTKSMDFEAARTELAECNVQLERLKAQLNSASDLVKAQTEAFKIADSKREEMRSELARVQALLAESKSQLQQSQKESQAKLNSALQSHDLELNEHVRTKAQKMSIEERCKAFEKSLTMREGEVSELKAENARLEEILRLRREAEQKALKERIAELEAQISPYEGRTAAQKARIQELEALLSNEQAQKQKTVNEAGALKYELDELKRSNVVLAEKIKMHEAEISRLHSLHSQCEGRSKTQQARIEDLESLLRAEQVQKQKAANDAVALKYELDELKKNVEDYLARLKEMSEALRTAREELERTTLALTSAKVLKICTKELGKPKM
jgi:chromosome segregation ATPase